MKRLLALLFLSSAALGQDRSLLVSGFESAASEFSVPVDVLKGIAFAESRWFHVEYADNDTANCMGMPHQYGVMALRDDAFFGHSLRIAADLIGQDPDVLKRDPLQNIRGAAAYLRKLYDSSPLPPNTSRESFESWQTAIARYCGIPQPELAAQHVLEIYTRLSKGYNDHGISLRPRVFNLNVVQSNARTIFAEARTPMALRKATAQPDYPLAHWASAYTGHWYTDLPYGKWFVVIHDMEGYYLSTISYFQLSSTNASIHYDVNGMQDSPSDVPAGDITQQVEEQYAAWHAVCLNRYSLGIEHEGFVGNPAWWTPEMYRESAKLVKHMCDKFAIPKDRNHIIGHGEYQNPTWVTWAQANAVPASQLPSTFNTCNSHTDPGPNWDWGFYMQLIQEDSTPPHITSLPPGVRVQVFSPISVTFDQRMDRIRAEQSFHISPAAPGTLSWSNVFRTLVFTPSSPLLFDTTYTVTIDTGAHNYLNIGLDVNNDGHGGGETYSMQFQTVLNDTIPPALTATYPVNGQSDISTTVQFEMTFSEPLMPATLTASMLDLRDSVGAPVTLTGLTTVTAGSGVRVFLRPSAPLSPSAGYAMTVQPTMEDYGGNTISGPVVRTFRTGVDQSFSGTVINALDAVGSWWQPSSSGSTVGMKSSSFAIATDIKKSGTGSGKIAYEFAGASGGVLREYNGSKPVVDPGPLVSAWVFGDNSGNALEYWFYPGPYTPIRVDTLDWTGWKLVSTSIASVPTTATRQFAGFVIVQIPGARTSGTVYFDDLAVVSSINGVTTESPSVPSSYRLQQNYPNPFNPTTVVRYQVSGISGQSSVVTLKVYDVLGREVATLVEGVQPPGTYHVTWNAAGMASGVYFCRLEAGPFVDTKKMLLLK